MMSKSPRKLFRGFRGLLCLFMLVVEILVPLYAVKKTGRANRARLPG